MSGSEAEAIRETMALLAEFDMEQLKDMFNDDDKFDSFVKDIRQLKQCDTTKDLFIASSRSLAEYNLSKEPELTAIKQNVLEKSEEAAELCQSLREKLGKLELQKSNVTLDTVLALLETKAAQSEEASDAIADNFLKGKTDVDEFLEEFSKERKLMHLRKVKVDKMGELMRKKQQSETSAMNNPSMPAFSFYPPQFPPSAVRPMIYPPGPAQVPYPLANMPMPMPMSRMTPKNPYF